MGIPLSKLMEDIGSAVQKANTAIEQYAAAAYLAQGYAESKERTDHTNETMYEPITYMLNIPTAGGKKKIQVPATALMHHSSLQLEQVDVKLRFALEQSEGEEVLVRVKDAGTAGEADMVSELSMQFKTAPPAEGTARIENRHIQTL